MKRRSIFKRKVYDGRYILTQLSPNITYNRHEYEMERYLLKTMNKYIKDETLIELEIDMPLLEKGEKFYIEELESTVTINERIRSSKENVVYYVDDLVLEPDEEYKVAMKRVMRTKEYKDEIIKLTGEMGKLKEELLEATEIWHKLEEQMPKEPVEEDKKGLSRILSKGKKILSGK